MTYNTFFCAYYSAVVSFYCWRLLGKVQLNSVCYCFQIICLVVLTFSNICHSFSAQIWYSKIFRFKWKMWKIWNSNANKRIRFYCHGLYMNKWIYVLWISSSLIYWTSKRKDAQKWNQHLVSSIRSVTSLKLSHKRFIIIIIKITLTALDSVLYRNLKFCAKSSYSPIFISK